MSILLSGCLSDNNEKDKQKNKLDDNIKVSYIDPKDEKVKILKKKGGAIAKIATVELGKKLKIAIDELGLEEAINFCNIEALELTDSVSKAEGVTIKRVAKKYRNPMNETSPEESKIYKQYVMEWLTGVPLISKIAIGNDGHPVYYKPIIISKKCLMCHGKPGENMPSNISDRIAELYPDDKAINFEDGHPRGMWAITFTDITVNKK